LPVPRPARASLTHDLQTVGCRPRVWRIHSQHTANAIAETTQLDANLDAFEYYDQEDSWLDKLRAERARLVALDLFDYVELIGF
jgi:hypothetical protein